MSNNLVVCHGSGDTPPKPSSVLVYLAGPLETGGDITGNIAAAVEAADELREVGREHGIRVVVLVPHLSTFEHMLIPRPREEWLADDLVLVERSDALYRIAGRSHGADDEASYARTLGRPVFRDLHAFGEWLASLRVLRGGVAAAEEVPSPRPG